MTDHRPDIPGYDIEAELGRGGMGVVYRVRRHRDGAMLALKMMLRGRGASFAELARFRVEAEALACLNHPNIVKIRDIGVCAGCPYFALEFAGRGSLRQVIAAGPQPPRPAAELVRTLATALQHAHERGMLHRDLKPANVLLMADGSPKVSDFGLVKFIDPIRKASESYCTFSVSPFDMELSRLAHELGAQYRSLADAASATGDEVTRTVWEECAARTGVLIDGTRLRSVQEFLSQASEQSRGELPELDGLTNTGAVMGTPTYMAPEQATGDHAALGPHTDVYALGGILYELLTGRPHRRMDNVVGLFSPTHATPYTASTPPRQLVPDLSDDIEAVCLKCLEKSPNSRYPRAADLADDLNRFLDGYTPRLSAASRRTQLKPPANPNEEGSTQTQGDSTAPSRSTTTRSWWPFGRSRSKPGS